MNRAERVAMVDRGRTDLSVRRQSALLGLARSGIYRKPAAPDPEELALMGGSTSSIWRCRSTAHGE
jgi:hypothetical protein